MNLTNIGFRAELERFEELGTKEIDLDRAKPPVRISVDEGRKTIRDIAKLAKIHWLDEVEKWEEGIQQGNYGRLVKTGKRGGHRTITFFYGSPDHGEFGMRTTTLIQNGRPHPFEHKVGLFHSGDLTTGLWIMETPNGTIKAIEAKEKTPGIVDQVGAWRWESKKGNGERPVVDILGIMETLRERVCAQEDRKGRNVAQKPIVAYPEIITCTGAAIDGKGRTQFIDEELEKPPLSLPENPGQIFMDSVRKLWRFRLNRPGWLKR